MMYEIVTLAEVKDWLNISGSTQDTFLGTLRTAITSLVESYIRHRVITRQVTELRDGEAQHELFLADYPVYLEVDTDDNPSNVTVYDDTERAWDSDSLVAADDYFIDPDTGVLSLYNDEWRFSTGVSCIKLVYRAGFSRFNVVSGENNYLDVKEDDGAEVSVAVDAKRPVRTAFPGYDAEAVATAVQTALNAASGLSGTYTVSYSQVTQKFTISVSGITKLSLLWSTGTNAARSIGGLLGYDTTADDDVAGTTSYTADTAVTGVPEALKLAAQQIALKLWEDSKHGISIQNVKREVMPQGTNREWVKDQIPQTAALILNGYTRMYL